MFFDLKSELSKHIKKLGLEKSLSATHACHQARTILADELQTYEANILKFQQGKIFIKCNNGIARHEIFYNKHTYLRKLQEQINDYQIDEIVIC